MAKRRTLGPDAQIHNPFLASSSICVDYARTGEEVAYHYHDQRERGHTATFFVRAAELVHEYHGHGRHLSNVRTMELGSKRGECWLWNGTNWRFSHTY